MTKLDLSIGSSLTFVDEHGGDLTGRIYGFFSYWPGYEPCSYSLNSDGTLRTQDNYLVVGNLSFLQDEWDVYPYEVWIKTDGKTEGIYEFIEESRTLKLTKFNDLSEIREDIRADTMFQGTNGILTMSFIIVLVLCAVGYLIYWIMSIRSRELLFGVLRAMGMKKTEITQMLMLEQILSGFYSIIAGSIIGFVASYMFVPLVQGAYAASNQVLPLVLTVSLADMIKLFATILMVVVVCIVVIVKIVSGMNISGALKLGED
nr:FtsX-like permease family protein [Lachnospiraceae bacterium]